ncbi:tetratricopeptide repeat protein [uncultured Aquimarina sp.]|uniref:tetratricopeptide repeat-containing sensor histidine kinase n=1 Tax=uncultured Aquimarina sp. TaxID=575652 RepID=UPI0026350835|nr:tetratricopeptide repeat protein [uncultured Aquimarina sp.]
MAFFKSFLYCINILFLGCFAVTSQEALDKELNKPIILKKESLQKLLRRGDSLFKTKDITNAKKEYDKAFELIQNSSDIDSVKKMIYKIERFFTDSTREYLRAMNVLNFLSEYCADQNDQKCLMYVNNRLGLLHNRIGEYIKALEYYGDALTLASKDDNSDYQWDILLNRGVLFLDIGDHDQAKIDFKRALIHIDPEDTKKRKGTTYLNLSATFNDKQADSILYYSRLAAVGCEKNSLSTRHCIMVYNNIAWAYYLKKMPKEALQVIRTNIEWDNDNLTYKDGDDLYPGLMHTMGAIQYELGNYDKALEYFLISKSNFEKKNDISDLITVKEDLSKLYETKGDLKASIQALRDIRSLESRQLKVKVSKELAKSESKNLLLAKEKVISGLEEKNLKIEKEVSKTKWQSYFLGLLLVVTVVVLVYRGYINRIKYYKINEKLTHTRLTSLRSSMNPHFLFNSFNTLQNYILKNDNIRANEYMTELSGLIRNVLNSSDSVYISFKKELEIVKSYVNLQRGRFQEEFEATFHVDPILLDSNPRIPSMILQPFIENAIIHGFSHSSISGQLNITLRKEEGMVICKVVDNGIGREASERLKKKATDVSHLSIATENTNERLGILNKVVNGQSNIVINDLYDTNGKSQGTEVIITLPIIKEIKK